nr:SGNH/GDSL hydrolase family protein [Ramlibacter tataouinensis]
MAANAQQADSAAAAARARWQSSLAAFEAADKLARPSDGGVLFVGSSTIRLWDRLSQDFSQLPVVINRGFGGSTMDDCGHFARQLVVAYRPRHVLVYAGDNDLAEGRSPAQVLESFQAFVRTVRAELPDTRIDYISIKPSPLRAALLPRAREANALLAGYVATLPNAGYIDVFTPMLDGAGAPRADLYGPDRLHMNAAGYALWRSVIAARVTTPPAPLESPSPALATRAVSTSPR